MKDKLRDYADRLERGEPWMHKGAKFTKWIKEVVSDMRNDAAILDAEGDGGAVAWLHVMTYGKEDPDNSHPQLSFTKKSPFGKSGEDYSKEFKVTSTPLCNRPVRSGVVSDEDVRDVARYRWLRKSNAALFDVGQEPEFNFCVVNDQPEDEDHWVGSDLDAAIDIAIQGERHER